MKKCVIIGNGEFDKIRPDYMAEYIIGADFYMNGVDLLIGDFDTLESLESVPDNVEVMRFPSEKNESDLELAVNEAVNRGFDTFLIPGADNGVFRLL